MPKNSLIPVFIPHAGCPHDCVFCDQRQISGRLAPPTPDSVSRIISSAAEKLTGPAELAFYGGSFTCLPLETQREYLLAAEPFLKNGTLREIRVSTRPDAIDGEVLRLLSDFGVRTVELGAQSMDDGVLRLSNRGHDGTAVENASRMVRDHGFRLILQLMFGLPGDSAATARQTCLRAAALAPDGVRFYPTVVIRNTRLHQMTVAGEYTPLSVEDAVTLCADLLPIFTEKNIPVIRLGLNPTDELSSGDSVVGGAYHPALGELVWSRYFFCLAQKELALANAFGRSAELLVHPRRLSVMAGQHRCNSKALICEFGLKKLRILPGHENENGLRVRVF